MRNERFWIARIAAYACVYVQYRAVFPGGVEEYTIPPHRPAGVWTGRLLLRQGNHSHRTVRNPTPSPAIGCNRLCTLATRLERDHRSAAYLKQTVI